MLRAARPELEIDRIWTARSRSLRHPYVLLVTGFCIIATAPARAESLSAGTPDCGGDAYSTAEVIEKRPPRRGPLTAIPQTLCADLAPQRPADVEIGVYPTLVPRHGAPSPSAPYEGWPAGRDGHPRF